jgi:N6-adenosine-specific RNA methylase IME4
MTPATWIRLEQPERERLSFTTAEFEDLRGYAFRTVMADPPWAFKNKATRGAVVHHYPTMTDVELATLPVAEVVANDAHLHLWVPNAILPRGLALLAAWGFEYRTNFVWVKRQIGTGNYWRQSHELLLLGIRGKKLRRFDDRGLWSWELHNREKHSAKPEAIRRLVERASPGPRLELFGRSPAAGWVVFGNQAAGE